MTRWLPTLLALLLIVVPAYGTISIVGSVESGTAGNDTSVTCNTPSGTTTDDVMYLFWMKDDDPTPTGAPADTGGTWSSLESNGTTTGDHRASGFYRMIVTGSPAASYTITGDREAWVCLLVSLRGVSTSTPEDVANTGPNPETDTTAPTALGLTPATDAGGPNIWVFSGCDVGTITFDVPSGYSVGASVPSTNIDTALGYKTNASQSVESDADFTITGEAGDCQAYMLAVRDDDPPVGGGRTRRMF